jgi:hypothetical protein
MNGNFRTPSDNDHDEGLDPELTQLFDAGSAPGPATGEAFANSVLLEIQRVRRLRLIRQVAGATLVMVIGAYAAPYAARGTLLAAEWLIESPAESGNAFVSSIGYICVSLIAWRIARWARAY